LEDRDGSVRVLAATVMARQHNAYTKRIGALQAFAKTSPERPDHWGELGRARLDYAGSGLLEASRADAEATRARADLIRAKQLAPDDTVTQVRVDAAAGDTAFSRQVVAPHALPQ
jgi:predicted Zn-dependent protease